MEFKWREGDGESKEFLNMKIVCKNYECMKNILSKKKLGLKKQTTEYEKRETREIRKKGALNTLFSFFLNVLFFSLWHLSYPI